MSQAKFQTATIEDRATQSVSEAATPPVPRSAAQRTRFATPPPTSAPASEAAPTTQSAISPNASNNSHSAPC